MQSLTPDDVADHYRLYCHVAGLAAARVAAALGDADLARLRSLHEALEHSTDSPEHERLSFLFRRAINTAGATRPLTTVLRLLTRSLPMHDYEFVPGWKEHAVTHHAAIPTALEARDPVAAQTAMADHLADSADRAIERLRAVGFFADVATSDGPDEAS